MKNNISPSDMDIILFNTLTNKKIYHISKYNLDNIILKPRIPNNFLVKNGYEDNYTPRISFAPTITNCLIGLARPCYKQYFYVHIPNDYNGKIYYPSIEEVPDVKHNKEIWLLDDVKLKVIYKIYVNGFDDKTLKYSYGDNIAELYKWKYKIIKYYIKN